MNEIKEAYQIFNTYFDTVDNLERPGFIKYTRPIFFYNKDNRTYLISYLLHKISHRPLIYSESMEPTVSIVYNCPPAVLVTSPAIEEAILINDKLRKSGYKLYFPYAYNEMAEKIFISEGLLYKPNLLIPLINFLGKVLRKKEYSLKNCSICGYPTYNYSRICMRCLRLVPRENLNKFRETLNPEYLKCLRDNFYSNEKTISILLGLRYLDRIMRNLYECDICKSEKTLITKHYNLPWFFVCSNCASTYNVPLIELDLLNKVINLEDLQDSSIRLKYLRK
ncbi:MAG: hypothetical protein QXK24_00020 [Ignisphaera sp.]